MTTAELVTDRALGLAGSDVEDEVAVRELLDLAGEHRVAVVRARHLLNERLERTPEEPALTRAVALVDDALVRLPI